MLQASSTIRVSLMRSSSQLLHLMRRFGPTENDSAACQVRSGSNAGCLCSSKESYLIIRHLYNKGEGRTVGAVTLFHLESYHVISHLKTKSRLGLQRIDREIFDLQCPRNGREGVVEGRRLFDLQWSRASVKRRANRPL